MDITWQVIHVNLHQSALCSLHEHRRGMAHAAGGNPLIIPAYYGISWCCLLYPHLAVSERVRLISIILAPLLTIFPVTKPTLISSRLVMVTPPHLPSLTPFSAGTPTRSPNYHNVLHSRWSKAIITHM